MRNALIVSLLLSGLTFEIANANGLLNGDFETPVTDGANYATPPEGFGWQLVPGTDFDLMRTYWQPSTGAQSLDLNGFTAGSIYQDFSFDYSGYWNISYDLSAAPSGPSSKTVQVDFGLAGGPLTTLRYLHDRCHDENDIEHAVALLRFPGFCNRVCHLPASVYQSDTWLGWPGAG